LSSNAQPKFEQNLVGIPFFFFFSFFFLFFFLDFLPTIDGALNPVEGRLARELVGLGAAKVVVRVECGIQCAFQVEENLDEETITAH
jgi:hypothetical protein